jgi:hypothetical protein
MSRFFCKKNFSSPWCLCCRQTDGKDKLDKLQGKARSRLYAELDILQIIQKLRVSRFVAELNLTEEERYLVNYHSEYMLFRDDKVEKLNAPRYTDHRPPNEQEGQSLARDDRIKKNAENCINGLDHESNTGKKTYKKIMARVREEEE